MNGTTKVLTVSASMVVAASLAVGGWAWAHRSQSQQEHPTVQQLIELVKPELNDEQALALADGVLTREEYEAARDRVVGCLEASGFTVHREPGRGPGGVDEISAESPPSAGNLSEEFIGCYDRHQGRLSMVWAEQHRPTPEELAAHERAVDSCIAAKGFDPKSIEGFFGKDAERASAYMGCLAEVGPPSSGAP